MRAAHAEHKADAWYPWGGHRRSVDIRRRPKSPARCSLHEWRVGALTFRHGELCETTILFGSAGRMSMTTSCPICRSEAAALDKTGDADGFDCHEHGKFKVASSVFAQASTKSASREQWEAALKRAKTRQPGAWAPVILTDDFR
jgi:hypothetical protein